LSGAASAAEAAAVGDLSRCEIVPDRTVEVYSRTMVTAGKPGQEASSNRWAGPTPDGHERLFVTFLWVFNFTNFF